MFTNRTLLVLGAGASKHLGYPLGTELCELIKEHLRSGSTTRDELLREGFLEKEIDLLSEALAHKGVSGYQASKPNFEEHLQSNGTNYLKYSGKCL